MNFTKNRPVLNKENVGWWIGKGCENNEQYYHLFKIIEDKNGFSIKTYGNNNFDQMIKIHNLEEFFKLNEYNVSN